MPLRARGFRQHRGPEPAAAVWAVASPTRCRRSAPGRALVQRFARHPRRAAAAAVRVPDLPALVPRAGARHARPRPGRPEKAAAAGSRGEVVLFARHLHGLLPPGGRAGGGARAGSAGLPRGAGGERGLLRPARHLEGPAAQGGGDGHGSNVEALAALRQTRRADRRHGAVLPADFPRRVPRPSAR